VSASAFLFILNPKTLLIYIQAVFMMLPFPITARRGFHDKLSEGLIEVGRIVQNEPSGKSVRASERTNLIEVGFLFFPYGISEHLISLPEHTRKTRGTFVFDEI
jgi:hypothetical protein